MHYEYIQPILQRANSVASNGCCIGDIYNVLRAAPLADYVDIMFHSYCVDGALEKVLPGLPTPEMQRRWTGHSGRDLFNKSCNIIRLLQACSYQTRNKSISGVVVDYGCGWGRLTRLLSYFSDPDLIYGFDPMQDSLDQCKLHGVHGNFSKIPSNPKSLPLSSLKFDFSVVYSVFTHTPPIVTSAVLGCLRRYVASDGAIACTIRPLEFWNLRTSVLGQNESLQLMHLHRDQGYAFHPIGGGLELSSHEYGDTSMSIDFFSDLAAKNGWNVGFIDRDSNEPFQLMIGLVPKG